MSPASSPQNRLPKARPSNAVVEPVRPVVDGGRFPAKAAVGEPVHIRADVFTHGHAVVAAAVRWRKISRAGGRGRWQERPMAPLGNDRFGADLVFDDLGRWEYDVLGWVDHLSTWRRDTAKKVDAGVDVALELQAGITLLDETLEAGQGSDDDRTALEGLRAQLADGVTSALDDTGWAEVFHRTGARDPVANFDSPLRIDVDPLRATFSSWYEFFPRSTVADQSPPGTLADAIDRLDYIEALGFDVVYLPPVHPIGTTKRKGRNNSTTATPDDVGSPWAIGAGDGGHTAVSPDLGTVADVERLADACASRDMSLALDIAFQCSPDHPWVRDHPEWFAKRSDGSIQFAENPPKKYEDIYPIDFESADWENLWTALADVFRFWIERGVTTFRVDNPHTKAFAFWEWAIDTLRTEHPETVFLAEAFTRPRVMERLAKIGFSQSYTYFAWRRSSAELAQYFTELSTDTVDYFRPNVWPNTPDILTDQLQTGGRPMFVARAILAATLSPSWGIYGPAFELLEHLPVREGSEEYLDSEKYQLRHWNLSDPDSIAPLIARLNRIRRELPAMRRLDTIRFHPTDDPAVLCFSKTDPAGRGAPILVVVNLDHEYGHTGFVDIDPTALDLQPLPGHNVDFDVVDQLGGGRFRWSGGPNYVELSPWSGPAHVFSVERLDEPDDAVTARAAGGTS